MTTEPDSTVLSEQLSHVRQRGKGPYKRQALGHEAANITGQIYYAILPKVHKNLKFLLYLLELISQCPTSIVILDT